MAVDVTTWRVRIGLFNASGRTVSVRRTTVRELYDACGCILSLVTFLFLLLVINGNVEMNPGPPPRRQDRVLANGSRVIPGVDQCPERPPRGLPKVLTSRSQVSPQLDQKVRLPDRSVSTRERRYVPDPTGLSPRRHPTLLRTTRVPPPEPLHNVFIRVDQLNKFVVPLERLFTADYCFEIPYDFSLKKGNVEYNNQMTSISCIICGLLNGGGGCLFIKGYNHPESNKHKCVDEWQNKVKDHLELFVPKNLFVHSVIFNKFTRGYDIVVNVKMSPTLVTYRSNLHWRNGTSSLDLREYSEVALALKSKSGERVPGSEQVYKSHRYYYDQDFVGEETIEREFKFYETPDIKQLWNKISQDKVKSGQLSTFERTLFAFANMENGGEILLGVRDDGKILGQALGSSERQQLGQSIGQLITENIEGKKRIWGTPDYTPEENKDWFVRFHVVTKCPNPSEDRFVVQIYIPSFRHCVFSAEPECYSLEYNGSLRIVPFDEWMKLMSTTTQTINHVLPREDQTFPIDKIEDGSDKGQQFKSNYDETTMKALATELHDYEKLDYAGSESKTLLWTRDSDVWTKSHKYQMNDQMCNSGTMCNELLKPQHPMNILPSREILDSCLVSSIHTLSAVWDFIANQYTKKLTILGCSDLCSIFPELKKLKTPQGHVADMFVISENSDLAILVLCSNTSICLREQQEYVYNAVRMMKKCILSRLFTHGLTPTSTVVVCGYLWDLDSETVKMREPKKDNCREKCMYPLSKIQLAINEMIYKGDKYLKTRLDEELTIELTKNQMKQLLAGHFSKVTVFRGPPGSGKTVMSLCICDNNLQLKTHTKKQMMYICPTKPLARLVEHQDKCRVQTAKTGQELLSAIQGGFKEGVRCFIVDDIQYISCEQSCWLDICDTIDTPGVKTKLYLFLDSTYQNMLSYDSETTIINALSQYRRKHRFFSYAVLPQLNEILRNTHVVASFFMANIKDTKAKQDLICNHNWTGDEVTVQTCGDILSTKDNPVVGLAKEIINARSWNYKHMYTPKDTVVLVDTDGRGNAKKLVKQLITVFKKHYKAHTADVVPVEGIVIEEVKNFVGLEAKAVIVVLTDQFDRLQHFQKDTYLSFLSSRGIMRVAFLLPNIKLPDVIKHMNFSEEDIWIKRSYDLLARMKQLATPHEDLEVQHLIERDVPKTTCWTYQVDLLAVSRKLRSVFCTGSSKEVELYISTNFLAVQHDYCRAMWLDDLKSQLKKLDMSKNDLEAWCARKVPLCYMEEINASYWSMVKPKIVSYANQGQREELNRWIGRYVPKSWLSGENVIPVFSTLFCDNILKSEPTKCIRMIAEVIQDQCVESSSVDIQVTLLEQLCERLIPRSFDLLLDKLVEVLLETELVGVIAFNAWFTSSNTTNNNQTADHRNAREATQTLHKKLCSMESIVQLCRQKIANKYHPEKLTCWFEQNVDERLQRDLEYVGAITATIVKCALQGPKVDLVQLYFSFVTEYLRTPPSIQRIVLETVYSTAMEQRRHNDLLVIVNVLLRYNFVDVEVSREWANSLCDLVVAPEISTLCEDYRCKRALTTREQILMSVRGSGSEGAEWLKPDHAFYWHDMSHYQSLVLATICEIIVTSPADTQRILRKCNEFYLPAVNNKVGLLYSLQCIVHYKGYAKELVYKLWKLMLWGSHAPHQGHFSKEVFLEWSSSKYPLRSEGREQALEAFRLFKTSPGWTNKL